MVNGIPISYEESPQPFNNFLKETSVNETTNLNGTTLPISNPRKGILPNTRIGKLIGFELGLGLGPGLSTGYGYGGYGGGYGNVPFPCSTSRLASFGFPYYNPVCYGYAVPSFPYYGGPLG